MKKMSHVSYIAICIYQQIKIFPKSDAIVQHGSILQVKFISPEYHGNSLGYSGMAEHASLLGPRAV